MITLTRHSSARLAALMICGAGLLVSSGAVAVERPSEWGTYRDKDAGVILDLPAHIFPVDSAKEGRPGTVFSSSDGRARMRVFAMSREANESPKQFLARIVNRDAATFTYVRTAPTFFVASGTQDGMIFYRRCNFGSPGAKRVGCIQLDYPQREKRAWDAAVTRMSHSLRVTQGD